MKRFFVEDISAESEYITISGSEFRHLKGVLRLTRGSEVSLFNGKGVELQGVVESVGKHSARVIIKGKREVVGESPVSITLLQGLVKGEKPEFVVQKATELGVREIRFYTTPRTIPVIDRTKAGKKVSRWRRVSVEAAKQCKRSVLPEINITDFKKAIKGTGQLKILFEKGTVKGRRVKGRARLKGVLKRLRSGQEVVLLVGPEGGLSEAEVAAAVKEGFQPVSLGPRTLRAETAAVAALSIIQYELGDMK
jgi:16S rRNA (uracil1498-N3)-methyltransferase